MRSTDVGYKTETLGTEPLWGLHVLYSYQYAREETRANSQTNTAALPNLMPQECKLCTTDARNSPTIHLTRGTLPITVNPENLQPGCQDRHVAAMLFRFFALKWLKTSVAWQRSGTSVVKSSLQGDHTQPVISRQSEAFRWVTLTSFHRLNAELMGAGDWQHSPYPWEQAA